MKIVVTAGGTGGHIYPALAIIKKFSSSTKILFIGTSNRMEKDIVPNMGINYVGIDIEGLNRKNIFKNVKVLIKYLKAKRKIKKILVNFKPDAVLGCGGYISLPVLKVAQKMRIKTYLHEQNSIPGLANKLLSKKATKIFVSLNDSINYFDNKRTYLTGNPRSEEVINVNKVTKQELGFNDKPLVLIVMGSLGSKTMVEKINRLVNDFKGKNYNVLIISGKEYYEIFKNYPENIKVMAYTEKLINILKSTDLIVTRAGATTIAEITALGVPSILVPSPYVTNHHQEKNAITLEKAGTSIIVSEDQFLNDIIKEIDNLINDKEKLIKMKEASEKLLIKESATKIVDYITKDINNG